MRNLMRAGVIALAAGSVVLTMAGCIPGPPDPSPRPVPSEREASTAVSPEPGPTDPNPDPDNPDPEEPPTDPPGDRGEPPLATQFGLGTMRVGNDVSQVEDALGLTLEVQWTRGECVVRLDENVGIGTVDNDGAVQTYVVLNPAIRTNTGLGVGSTYEDIAAAYPKWTAGYTGETTKYGGKFVPIQISLPGTGFDNSSTGRHLMFELDADGKVKRYRVGAPSYVFHTEICYSP